MGRSDRIGCWGLEEEMKMRRKGVKDRGMGSGRSNTRGEEKDECKGHRKMGRRHSAWAWRRKGLFDIGQRNMSPIGK